MVIVVIVFATDVAAVVAVVIVAVQAINAVVIAVSFIIRVIVIVAYGSTPFTAGFQMLLSVIKESFAAIESCYLEFAQV